MIRKIEEKYKEYKLSKRQHHVDGICNGVIFGWVISPKEPTFEVYINKAKIDLPEKAIVFYPSPEIHPMMYKFGIDLRKAVELKEGDEINLFINGRQGKNFPKKLERSLLFGKIDFFSGIRCFGWLCSALETPSKIQVYIDKELLEVETKWYTREDFRKIGIDLPVGFEFKIPEAFLDGRSYKLSLVNPYTGESIGKEKEFRFHVKRVYIDKADLETIEGWLQVGDHPGPVDLDIFVDGKKVGAVRADFLREDASKIYGEGCFSFYHAFTDEEKDFIKDSYSFSIYLSGTNIKVTDSYQSIATVDILESLEKIAQEFNNNGKDILRYSIKTAIDIIRANYRYKVVTKFGSKNITKIIDVIIPVYKGKEETIQCIESVLNAKTNVTHEVIVINDCSPEEELKEYLLSLAKSGKITLIENKENLGFVKSVNIGMKLHQDRDVVLLNSDTLVPDYWLDRLKRAAYSSKNIGTVTPLSNRATILSIPRPNFDNDLPSGFEYKKMDNLCQRVNDGMTVDIPSAIGFCMYIKRECLNEVGYFDEEKFDRGYGEENDFCLKASSLGWRHVACLDLFVQHYGSLSFGEEKPERVKKALEIINQLYPEYNLRIQNFIKKDPIATYRNRIIKEMFREKYETFILSFIHSWGGGSLKYCKDIAEFLIKEGVGSIFIQPENGKVSLFLYEPDEKNENVMVLQFPEYVPMKRIAEELKDLSILFVNYNQTVGFKNLEIWDVPKWLDVPYFVTLHDYFYICPRIHLINSGGIFCGLPEFGVCESCLSFGTLEKEVDTLFKNKFDCSLAKWREFYKDVLRNAKKVIAPSETAKNYLNNVFNLENIEVMPHPEHPIEVEIKKPEGIQKLKIAVIGAIGEHKGYTQYLRLIDYSYKNNLPFEFIFLGYTKNDRNLHKYPTVIVTGPYKDEKELYNLVRAYNPHIALFL
ncbi:MAG: glycosyltransferase, partial [Aquificaceae bacterium]